MSAGSSLPQNYERIVEHEGDDQCVKFFEFLTHLGRVDHRWTLAGVLSKSWSQQSISRREAVALLYSNNTQFENTHIPGTTDDTSDTELLANHENTSGVCMDALPDVVSVAPCSGVGPHRRQTQGIRLSTSAMSSQRRGKKPVFKRTVSFDETPTRPTLRKDVNVYYSDGNVGNAAAQRRASSSGYSTWSSRESDVTDPDVTDPFLPSPARTPPSVEDDAGPQYPNTAGHQVTAMDTDCTLRSSDDISEDGEDPTVETVSDVRNSPDSSESSFILPEFEILGIEGSEAPDVGQFEAAGIRQLESLAEDMAEIQFEFYDPDPMLDENDLLLAQYSREIEEDNIERMIWEGADLKDMEEIIISQLPSEIADTGPAENPLTENPPVDEQVTHRLQMAAQCDVPDCDFPPCVQGQEELAALKKFLETCQTAPSRNENEKEMLHYLSVHAIGCEDELRCTVPWCQFICDFCRIHRLEGDISLERLRKSLHTKYFSGCHDLPSLSSAHCDVIQLQGGVPREGRNLEVLARLPPYKDVFLAIDLTLSSPAICSDCCVIKKLPYCQDGQVELLRRLRHPHIVTHHWLQHDPESNTAIVCTEFHADSICDWLRRSHPGGCHSLSLIQVILSHLLSAVNYLHSVNILYLAWTGSDVVVTCPSGDVTHAKLCDFSHAVSMEGELSEEDEEDMKQLLLPAIIPPERTLSLHHSDQWGLGCLLYEIALGYKVHRASVHEKPETRRQAAQQMPDLSDLERVDPVVAAVIRDCLQMPVEKRPTIEELQQRRLDV